MDDRNWLGTIAETKTQAEYLKNHWEVYAQTSGKGPFDIVVYKDGELRRVQVKATKRQNRSTPAYTVNLRSTRYNRNSLIVKKLDPTAYDELAVYVEPFDKVFFFSPEEVAGRDSITVHADKLDNFRQEPR